MLVSSGVRSRFRRFINENFFSLKYDYRVEWEKAIRELTVNPGQDTPERVLRILVRSDGHIGRRDLALSGKLAPIHSRRQAGRHGGGFPGARRRSTDRGAAFRRRGLRQL